MPNRAMADTPPELVKHQVLCHLDVLKEPSVSRPSTTAASR